MNNTYKGIILPEEFPEDINDKEFYERTLKLEKDIFELLISYDEDEKNEGIYQDPLASAGFFYVLYKSYCFYDENKSSYWKENLDKAVYYYYQKKYHDLINSIFETGNIDMFESSFLSLFNNFNGDKGFFLFLIQNHLLLMLEPPILIYDYHKEFGNNESIKFWYGILKTIYSYIEKESKSLIEGIDVFYDEVCIEKFTNFIDEFNKNFELYNIGKEILKKDANN